jgi:hypothetical protein
MLPLLAALAFALPHADTESVATFALSPDGIELTIVVDVDRILEVTQANPPPGLPVDDATIAAAAPAALDYVRRHWRLSGPDGPIALQGGAVAPRRVRDPAGGEGELREVALTFRLPPLRDVEVTLLETFFEDLESSHHHFVVLSAGTRERIEEFAVEGGLACTFVVPDLGPGAELRRMRTRLLAGLKSALLAPWLLALLAALLVAPQPRRARATAAVVALLAAGAAFAATRAGFASPAPWAATLAAAFAALYVALENLRARDFRLRSATALFFGLVDGMALAGGAGGHGGAAGDVVFGAAALAAAAVLAVAAAAVASRPARGRRFVSGAAALAGALGVVATALLRFAHH